MPKRVAVSTLNASTVDILNVIRQNASLAYQSSVPAITKATDIPKVGEVIYGTPAFANEFINALINRIALVRVKSATFNNPYARLKKGYLDYGETIEEVFVNIAKVFEFSQEKAEGRELKQYKPDVQSAFHAMNWRVIYPVSVSDEELRMAFLSAEGVTDMIARIVDSIYTAADYDEFLLFKYMLIKAATSGKFKPTAVDNSDMKNWAKAFRGTSNMLPFMSKAYNAAGVMNTTPKNRQVIFMDAQFNANFDVDVLSAAFNMDKADFMGSLYLIDDFTSFDNERFEVIRENSDGIEEVTDTELALMANVKAILLDEDWFQIYDNLARFAEKFVASGLRWNYFYHTWKTISFSPYANAVLFALNTATISAPSTLHYVVKSVDDSDEAVVITFESTDDDSIQNLNAKFVQTATLTSYGYAVQPYGALIMPAPIAHASFTIEAKIGDDVYASNGFNLGGTAGVYTLTATGTWASGDTITVDGTTITLNSTSAASVTAVASAVVSAMSANAHYTVTSNAGVVTLTEKSGMYGYGVPVWSKTSTAGVITPATTTVGKHVTIGVGNVLVLTKQ